MTEPEQKPRIVGSDGELLEPDKSVDYLEVVPLHQPNDPLLVDMPRTPRAGWRLSAVLLMVMAVALGVIAAVGAFATATLEQASGAGSVDAAAAGTAAVVHPLSGSVADEIRISAISNTVIRDCQWSPNGRQLAVSRFVGATRVWDVAANTQILTLEDAAFQLAWSPDGTSLLGIAENEGAVWNAQTGERVAALDYNPQFLDWSPDGAVIVIISYSVPTSLTLYDTQTNWTQQSEALGTAVRFDEFKRLLWTQGGVFIISSSSILRWDRTLDVPEIFQQRDVWSSRWIDAASSRDGRYLAVASVAGHSPDITVQVFVWDTTAGSTEPAYELTPFAHQEYMPVQNIFLSPDGTQLATVRDADVILWDMASGTQVRSIELTADVTDVDWSPDGTHLALCSRESVRIYALDATGSE